jgi:hypothetical protein
MARRVSWCSSFLCFIFISDVYFVDGILVRCVLVAIVCGVTYMK